MDRTILHCDLNGFYASVECLLRPELQNVPMAVGGSEESRHGIILAKNEAAKAYGVKTAETIWQARKKCPQLIIVPPHHRLYGEYSKKVNAIYERFTDLAEPFGIDESWLDVTGVLHIFGPGPAIADKIRETVRHELGLTISVGVSFNKVFAKLGSDYKKPDATTVITRDNFKSILFPLPVSDLLYVGRQMTGALHKMGIRTIGDLALAKPDLLRAQFGKAGHQIWIYANGLEDVKAGMMALSDDVAYRLRKYGLKCQTVQITIKDPSFKTMQRQKTLPQPTYLAKVISDTAVGLVQANWNLRAPIRMLTVTAAGLVDVDRAIVQTSLFDGAAEANLRKQEKLEKALTDIRVKYGRNAVSTGNRINRDLY